MQKLMGLMRSAMERYGMIEEGDRIAVGLSGGKDSVALLAALAEMRSFYPQTFNLTALILDPGFEGKEADFAPLEQLCRNLDIPFVIKRSQIGKHIFTDREEKNPCSLCARMRRGALHDMAKAANCSKLALGHHLDDMAETFLMNLLNGAVIDSFAPVTCLSRKNLTLIRPMIFARETDTARVVGNRSLPVIKSECPVDGKTERAEAKQLLNTLDRKYGSVREKILKALQSGEIAGF